MTFYYDINGCVTTLVDPERATEIVPPGCVSGSQPIWTGSGWICSTPTPPVPEIPTLGPNGTVITSRAFFKRMGTANAIWLYSQAPSVPELEYYKDVVWNGPVDLADPETASDLENLISIPNSPFTQAIITAILTTPINTSEVP